MNRVFLISLLWVPASLLAQRKIEGKYCDHFASLIELNEDSTFRYTWKFDLQYSWTKGTWTINKDTIYFHMVAVFDTLSFTKASGKNAERLILSKDENSERILDSTGNSLQEIMLNAGGQNYQLYPDKLFFKKKRLYYIHNGSLVKKRVREFWGKRKVRSGYSKCRY